MNCIKMELEEQMLILYLRGRLASWLWTTELQKTSNFHMFYITKAGFIQLSQAQLTKQIQSSQPMRKNWPNWL
jgi:hypothetical protein